MVQDRPRSWGLIAVVTIGVAVLGALAVIVLRPSHSEQVMAVWDEVESARRQRRAQLERERAEEAERERQIPDLGPEPVAKQAAVRRRPARPVRRPRRPIVIRGGGQPSARVGAEHTASGSGGGVPITMCMTPT